MSKHPAPSLRPGDRVRERDRNGGCVARPSSPNYHEICKILSHRREGLVVGLETRRNSRGTRCEYAVVRWDHLESPSIHAAFRLERIAPADDP